MGMEVAADEEMVPLVRKYFVRHDLELTEMAAGREWAVGK